MAGLDRRVERAPAEDVEALVETLGDRGGRQRAQAGGCELDGQRQPVEAAADGRHLVRLEADARPRRAGALLEQPVGGGLVQRRHRHHGLAGNPQGAAARDQHGDAGSRGREVARDGPEGGDEVLAAVEHEQRVGVSQALTHDGQRVPVVLADAPQAEHGRGREHHLVAASERRQLDEPRAS